MKKVYADPSIRIGPDDQFTAPLGWNMRLDCTGSDDDLNAAKKASSSDDYFF